MQQKTLYFLAATVLILYLHIQIRNTEEEDSKQRLAWIYSVYTSIVLLLAALSIRSFLLQHAAITATKQ